MWTPKRVLLLVLGFVICVTGYTVYAHFLGGVDGLPPLPADCVASDPGTELPIIERAVPIVESKLKLAFGANCPELQRAIKLEVRARGIVLAADHFEIVDGRVMLQPFSVALFGKEKVEGQYPEINTVQSDIAYLRFDQPISSPSDMANHKIVGAELVRGPKAGGVTIVNNRRTPQRDDDLWLTTAGPLYYEEERQQIWTAAPVRIVDEQAREKDNPTTIIATGMDVYLIAEEEKPGTPAAPPPVAKRGDKKEPHKEKPAAGITGVRSAVLRSDVDMHLFIDSQNGFLGTPSRNTPKPDPKVADAKTPADPKAPTDAKTATDPKTPNKDLVHIKTQGRFNYDMTTDRARFDIAQHPGDRPNNVEVIRRNGPNGANDQLNCEHLELQFMRKNSQDKAKTDGASADRAAQLEISTAHAWGSQVILASDVEVLTAFGNDLVYDALTHQTTLKGTPQMVALKDGNEIRGTILQLTGTGEKGAPQQAIIHGPGELAMLDSNTKERTQRARWKDLLVSAREGNYDLLTLTGDAVFEELEPGQGQIPAGQEPKLKQKLQADRLKVWLEPGDEPNAKSTPANGSGDGNRRRPHHLEAIGRVNARSPEMTVRETERLVIWFKDPALLQGEGPAALPATGVPISVTPPAADPHAVNKPPSPAAPAVVTPLGQSSDPNKPRKPIDLSARSVEVQVVRTGTSRNELDKLWCEGSVEVHQEGETPQDKGTQIFGQTLQLVRFPEGHVLTVTGNLAEVQLDKLTILGPLVNIDQKKNEASVEGLGVMRMPSNANLNGEKRVNDMPTELTVHWNRDMFFNGKYALFHGGVQAEQDESRLVCQTMQVFLDHFVSLKEGQKSDPPAKVENLVCDKNVRIEDKTVTNGKLTRYQRIVSSELSFNNEDGVMIAPGPGIVYMIQPGTKDEMGGPLPTAAGPGATPAAPARPANAPAEEEMKLTRVNYLGRMFANNATRTAVFYNNVEVVHLPGDKPDVEIDLNNLPLGAMYLRCDQLKVYTRKEGDEKAYQQMEARGQAVVQSREFWGRSDLIKYDESKELVIFEASEGSLATLTRIKGRGGDREEMRGRKIYYWRKTNECKVEGGRGANVIQQPGQ